MSKIGVLHAAAVTTTLFTSLRSSPPWCNHLPLDCCSNISSSPSTKKAWIRGESEEFAGSVEQKEFLQVELKLRRIYKR
ncbi:hypothetical protein PIB30_044912 [Stylosanthes scabra]|uniref:Uncharacterized protein n=1 Tax=Stylosanthes scabra TaxID=79078 RepID=A0ABU6WE29_9FABA|nr:hypothetical protein [Stylosanthes scabra]